MPISKTDAREIARGFLELAHALGRYRFECWAKLTRDQRREIEGAEWALLRYSSSLPVAATRLTLGDRHIDLLRIKQATARATRGVAMMSRRDLVALAGAVIVLGSAIASRRPAAVTKAAATVLRTVQEGRTPASASSAPRHHRGKVISISDARVRAALRTGSVVASAAAGPRPLRATPRSSRGRRTGHGTSRAAR